MRILTLHCDYIKFKALKKAVKDIEDSTDKEGEVKECLVVLTSVEQGDNEQTIKQLVEAVEKTAKEVKTDKIVLYPYAHLSSNLAKPVIALEVLQKAESNLKKNFKVTRAPFGYYKEFEFKCKGHPLAELSKTFGEQNKTQENTKPQAKKEASHGKIILDRKNLQPNDHRIIGEDLGIFHLSDDIGPGLPLWLPKGEIIRNELEQFMRKVEEKYGYQYVTTPHITKGYLYEKTGHLPYYADTMFPPFSLDGIDYYLKPMNCPHHHTIFNKIIKSYKDLPIRLAEAGVVYRNELSGVTYGLMRVRHIMQNDAHIYCTPDQLKKEFLNVVDMFDEVYKVMGIKKYSFRLSLPDFKKNPDKYTGDLKEWEHASEEIRRAMKDSGNKFVEETGEAAFYGPKIDVQIKNANGKEETIATIQVDIVIPKRLNITYVDDKGEKKHPIIIHRAILGSYERFMGFLLEQTEGRLPLWLSPRQVRIISFTDRNNKATEKLEKELKEAIPNLRVDIDTRSDTVQSKIRDAEMLKINYIVVIGDKEEENKTLAVRSRGEKPQFGVKRDKFFKDLKEEIENRN